MRVSPWAIPVIVVLVFAGGYFGRALFAIPTTSITVGSGEGSKLECIVAGVKCKGTATFFTSLFEEVEGVNGIETFAADHKAVITYDEAVITPEEIKKVIEQEVQFSDGSIGTVFECTSMKEVGT